MKTCRLLLPLLLAALPGPAAGQLMVYDHDNSRLSIEQSPFGNNLYTPGNITGSQYGRGRDVYANNGWLRNSNADSGLYNEALITYFYASVVDSTGGWNLASNTGGMELSMRSNHDYYSPTVYGSIFGDATNFGVKNNVGTAVLYAAANGLARIPGSLQIGNYGGILDNTSKTHASAVLDGAYGGYTGISFGLNSNSTAIFADGNAGHTYLYRSDRGFFGYLEWWDHSVRSLTVMAALYATGAVQENGRNLLTKVAYRMHCHGGNGTCSPPICADGTWGTSACSTLGSGWTCYRDCCWGTD